MNKYTALLLLVLGGSLLLARTASAVTPRPPRPNPPVVPTTMPEPVVSAD